MQYAGAVQQPRERRRVLGRRRSRRRRASFQLDSGRHALNLFALELTVAEAVERGEGQRARAHGWSLRHLGRGRAIALARVVVVAVDARHRSRRRVVSRRVGLRSGRTRVRHRARECGRRRGSRILPSSARGAPGAASSVGRFDFKTRGYDVD